MEILARTIALIVVLVRADMLAPAVGAALDERRPLAAAHASDCCGGQLAQFEHVAVVDLVHRHAVGRHALAQPVGRPTPSERRVDGVVIIFADKQDRQLLQRSKIQTLAEHALLGSAVAKET